MSAPEPRRRPGYLSAVLDDGARPFHHRGRTRSLLGAAPGTLAGLHRPAGALVYQADGGAPDPGPNATGGPVPVPSPERTYPPVARPVRAEPAPDRLASPTGSAPIVPAGLPEAVGWSGDDPGPDRPAPRSRRSAADDRAPGAVAAPVPPRLARTRTGTPAHGGPVSPTTVCTAEGGGEPPAAPRPHRASTPRDGDEPGAAVVAGSPNPATALSEAGTTGPGRTGAVLSGRSAHTVEPVVVRIPAEPSPRTATSHRDRPAPAVRGGVVAPSTPQPPTPLPAPAVTTVPPAVAARAEAAPVRSEQPQPARTRIATTAGRERPDGDELSPEPLRAKRPDPERPGRDSRHDRHPVAGTPVPEGGVRTAPAPPTPAGTAQPAVATAFSTPSVRPSVTPPERPGRRSSPDSPPADPRSPDPGPTEDTVRAAGTRARRVTSEEARDRGTRTRVPEGPALPPAFWRRRLGPSRLRSAR